MAVFPEGICRGAGVARGSVVVTCFKTLFIQMLTGLRLLILLAGLGLASTAYAAQINGTVSLPQGESADNGPIGVQLNFCALVNQIEIVYCLEQDLEVPANGSSVAYTLDYTEADSYLYQTYVTCEANCDPYLPTPLYFHSDQTSSFVRFLSLLATQHLQGSVDFELQQGIGISGTLQLPDSDVAQGDIVTRVEVCSITVDFIPVGCEEDIVTITGGASSANYLVAAIPTDPPGTYYFSYECLENCNPYLGEKLYLRNDLVTATPFSLEILASSITGPIELTLQRGQPIAGTISLPNNAIAATDIENRIIFCSLQDSSAYYCPAELVTIAAGNNSANYEIAVEKVQGHMSYSLEAQCISGCGPYIKDRQYLQQDLSWAFDHDRVEDATLPAVADISLQEGRMLSGQLVLPDSELAVGNVSGTVNMCSRDAAGQQISCDDAYIEILDGSNATNYSLVVQPAPANGYYTVSVRCISNCGLYLSDLRSLQNDLSFSYEGGLVDPASLPANLDISLDKGRLLTGLISLPNGEVAAQDLVNNFELCAHDANGSSISCNYSPSSTIEAGESSATYEASVRPAPNGGFYRLSTNCSDTCDIYITDQRTLQPDLSLDFTYTQVAAAVFPQSYNFELQPGQAFSGTLSLENGEVLPNSIGSQLRLCSFNAAGGIIDCTGYSAHRIPAGQNSTSFTTAVRPAPPDGFYQLIANCNTNCGQYQTNPQYLQADGSTDFAHAQVPASALPLTAHFVLTKGQVLNGTISLPNGELAENTIYSSVTLCSYTSLDSQIDCSYLNSTKILEGENSTNFSVSVLPAPADGYYRVSAYCSSNCGLFLRHSQYLQPDLSFAFEEAYIPASALPQSVDVELSRGRVVTGQVQLPTGEVAANDMSASVKLCSYDAVGTQLSCDNQYQVQIAVGTSSGSYALSAIPAPVDGYYQLNARCSSDCGVYLTAEQYLQGDGSTGFAAANLADNQLPGNSNLTLSKGQVLTGTVNLPSGAVATQMIEGTVRICAYTDGGGYIDCGSVDISIEPGTGSTGYATSVVPAPADGYYEASVRCWQNCGIYLDSIASYYQINGEFGYEPDQIPPASLPPTIDFTLATGHSINGVIQLPQGALATGDISSEVTICSYSANQDYIDCRDTYIQIAAGTNQSPYAVSIQPAPAGGYYRVETRCYSNCGIYQTEIRFLHPDLSFQYASELIPESFAWPNEIDITLDAGTVLSVNLSVPDGVPAAQRIYNYFWFCSYDEFGNTLGCRYANGEADIVSGQTQVSFQTSVPSAPQNGFYKFRLYCSDNCGQYLQTTRYLQTDFTLGYTDTFVPAAGFPGSLAVSLELGQTLSVNLNLPNGELAQGDIDNRVSYCAFDSAGQQLDCDQTYSATIPSGANSANFNFVVRPAPADGYYQFFSSCWSNCELYLNSQQHLQANLEFAATADLVPSATMPSSLSVTLPKGYTLTGNIRLPNAETANSNIYNRVVLCSLQANAQTIDCNETTATIVSGSNHQSYELTVAPAPANGFYRLYTECYSGCNPYNEHRTYLQADLSYGFESANVSATTMPASVDFTLSKNTILNGVIKLPGNQTATGNMSVNVTFCSYSAQQSQSRCEYRYFSIDTGSNQTNFEVNVRPAPTGGFYSLEFRCSSSCNTFLDVSEYLQPDLGFGYEVAYLTADDIPEAVTYTLNQGTSFAGEIVLPNAEVAGAEITNFVQLCSYGEAGGQLDCASHNVAVLPGAQSQAFSINLREAPETGFYRLSTYCMTNCGDYLTNTRYLQPGLGFDFTSAQVPAVVFPNPASIVLTKGITLSGSIQLPEGEIASDDLYTYLYLCAYNSAGSTVDCENQEVTIPSGQSSADYRVSLRAAPGGGSYRLQTSCSSCAPYLSDTRYLQNDLSIGFTYAFVEESNFPSTVNFTLTRGEVISGILQTPAQAPVTQTTHGLIELCSYDQHEVLLRCADSSAILNQGEAMADYRLGVRPAPSNGFYRLSMRCYSNCGFYLGERQYLQPDLSFSFDSALVPAQVMPSTVDFTLSLGKIITGSVALPEAQLSNNFIYNSIEVCRLDENQNLLDCHSRGVHIESGENSGEFAFSILPTPEGGFYRVSIAGCSNGCTNYINTDDWLQNDGTFAALENAVPAATSLEDLLYVLTPGVRMNGNVRLPGPEVAAQTIQNMQQFCSYDALGTELECKSTTINISSGALSRNYSIATIRTAPDDGFYRLSTTCLSGCGEYFQTPQYLRADLSTSFEVSDIPAALIPESGNFVLLDVLPDAYENDNTQALATAVTGAAVQRHNIHTNGDEDWIEIALAEQGDLSIVSKSDVDEAGTYIELFDAGLQPIAISELPTLNSLQFVSSARVQDLQPGTYFARITSISSGTISGYDLIIGDQILAPEDDQLCFPVPVKNGVTLICL